MSGVPIAPSLSPAPLAAGLIVLFLLGDGLYRLLDRCLLRREAARFNAGARAVYPGVEAWGLRILLGLAGVPWCCMVMDLSGIPIGRATLGAFALGIAILGGILSPPGRPRVSEHSWTGVLRSPAALLRSPAAVVLGLAVASLPLFSLIHVSAYPPWAYDAIVGFDLVGKILAVEGKLRSSVFTNIVFNAQTTYPPFTSTNQGFWYIFQPAIARLWVPLSVAGFALVTWGQVRRWTESTTAAGLAAFLMLTPPILVNHMTLGQTDLPCMVYISLGFYAMIPFLRRQGSVARPALFLGIATTVRTENVLFALALALIGLLAVRARPPVPGPGRASGASASEPDPSERARAPRPRPGRADREAPPEPDLPVRPRPWRPRWSSLWILVPSAAFFAFWNLFYVRGLIGYDPALYFRDTLDFAPARMWEVLWRAGRIILMFGELGWVIVLAPLLWAVGSWGRRRGWFPGVADTTLTPWLLLLLLVSFVFYMPFFYQWNPDLNPLWTMEHTFKRGFFRFIPALVIAFVASPPLLGWLRRCDPGRS